MGTRRKVAVWYTRRKGEYVILLPGRKKDDAELVFSRHSDMMEAARASRCILRDVGRRVEA
jgi:hypothetical protein